MPGCRRTTAASTMVTAHTASLIAAYPAAGSHPRTVRSARIAWLIAGTDHYNTLSPAIGSLDRSRCQTTRQPAEQNRACSRRGVNTAPHWAHTRMSVTSREYEHLRRTPGQVAVEGRCHGR